MMPMFGGLLGNPQGNQPGLLGGGFMDQMRQNRAQMFGNRPGAPGAVPFSQDPMITALGGMLVGGKNMAGRYDTSVLAPAMAARTTMQTQMAGKQEAAEKAQKVRQAMSAALIAKSSGKPLDPEAQAMLWEANPKFAEQMFGGDAGKPVVVGKDSRLVSPGGEVLLDASPDMFRSLITPEDRAAAGIPAEDTSPYQIGPDGKLSRPGGGVNVTNNLGGTAGEKFAEGLGTGLSKDFIERRTQAQDAAKSLVANADARKLLDGGVISGAGAEWIVGFGKALQQAGFAAADDAIANTEAFLATRAQEVGRIIKLFGAGTGLSDADRAFAQKAAAGDITMNEESIRRILDINDRAARNVIELFNQDASAVDPGMSPYPLTIEVPPLPEPAAPTPSTQGGDDGWTHIRPGVKIRPKP